MNKNYIFALLACLCLVACATKMHIEGFDLDTKSISKCSKDTLAALPVLFGLRRRVVRDVPVLDEVSMKVAKCLEKDPLSNLLIDKKYPSHRYSDVHLLLHLNKLDFSDKATLAKFVEERFKVLQANNPFSGMSDEQLFTHIRSRFIQSPSELISYCDFVSSSMKDVKKKADELIKSSVDVVDVDSATA